MRGPRWIFSLDDNIALRAADLYSKYTLLEESSGSMGRLCEVTNCSIGAT